MSEVQSEKLTREQAFSQLTAPGAPYELAEVMVRGHPHRTFVSGPQTLRELFEANRSDATLFVYEDERYTFEEAWQKASAIGHALVNDYGIEKGDRVAISMRNYPEWVFAFMAVTSIGAIAVAMNALWEADEMEYGLSHCGAKLIFADQERLERLSRIKFEIDVVAVRPTGTVSDDVVLIETLVDGGGEMPSVEVAPDDDATILYTSGSTGHPKGAVSSHRAVIAAPMSWELDGAATALANQAPAMELPYQVSVLLGIPLFHVAGLHAVLLASFRGQRKVVAMYKWDVAQAADLIEQEQISSFTAPAAMTGDLVDYAAKMNRDLSTLLVVGGGGAPRAPEQVMRIPKSFSKAVPNTGWGMTETNAIGTGIAGEDYLKRPGSSGRVSQVLELAIVDPEGRHLGAGERGELLIRGTSMFRGYWDNDAANEEAFVDDWFRTGDVAYIDDEGFLFIVDRIKQLIIRGGENIGCGEVEAALVMHPNVIEASVYGVPDERLGEEIGATLMVDDDIDEDALRIFLMDHLARFKIPKFVVMTRDELPRIAAGKINKIELRKQHLASLG